MSLYAQLKSPNEASELYYLLKKDGIFPSLASFNLFLELLVSVNRYNEVISVFFSAVNSGIRVDKFSYGKVIQSAVKLGDLKKGFELKDLMERSGNRPNHFVYNVMIGGLCKERRVKDARKMFNEMMERKVAPTKGDIVPLIDGYCKCGDVEAFRLREMMRECNVEVNNVTYNTLLSGLCNAGRMGEASKVLEEMDAHGIVPDPFTYRDMDVATDVFKRLKDKGFVPTEVIFNTIVNGYCKQGNMEKALSVIESMGTFGVKPTCVTFNTVISQFCVSGKIGEAEALFKKMTDNGISPNVQTYNILIDGYGRSDQFEMCFQMLEEMEKKGLQNGVVTYGSLINRLCKDGRVLEAELVLNDMVGRCIQPNAQIYNMLIDGSCCKGKLEDALRFFEDMLKRDIAPTVVTYNSLIKGMCKKGKFDEAEEQHVVFAAVTRDLELGIRPTVSTYHSLLTLCKKEQGLELLEKLVHEMDQMFLKLDRVVYNELIYCYAEHCDADKAFALHDEMVKEGISSDITTYNGLLLGCMKKGKFDIAKDLVARMKAEGLTPNVKTYNILIEGHSNLEDFDGAFSWYREMYDNGFIPTLPLCNQLISGLRNEGRTEVADIICSEMCAKGVDGLSTSDDSLANNL
ncbi:hypothetical protein Leryth_006712 [Lithospermum erythrorhizon]|nr:hypothetical protein Leryth_006712 [Lithospermum erythrorhizon]